MPRKRTCKWTGIIKLFCLIFLHLYFVHLLCTDLFLWEVIGEVGDLLGSLTNLLSSIYLALEVQKHEIYIVI